MGKKERKSKGKRAGDGGAQFDRAASTSGADGERWIKVGNVSELEEKPIKALVLANGNFCMVKYGSMVFITACNSTAYQYPLIDGDLFEGRRGRRFACRLTEPSTIWPREKSSRGARK